MVAEEGAGGAVLKPEQQSDMRDFGRVAVVLSPTERELQVSLNHLTRKQRSPWNLPQG